MEGGTHRVPGIPVQPWPGGVPVPSSHDMLSSDSTSEVQLSIDVALRQRSMSRFFFRRMNTAGRPGLSRGCHSDLSPPETVT